MCFNMRVVPVHTIEIWIRPNDHQREVGQCGFRIVRILSNRERFGKNLRENAYLEWMTCLSCGARWSRKTGQDDIQVKMGLIIDQPQLTPPCPGCASTTRLQQMTNKTETFFGCSRFSPCAKEWYTHLLLRNHVFHRLRTHVQQLSLWRSR